MTKAPQQGSPLHRIHRTTGLTVVLGLLGLLAGLLVVAGPASPAQAARYTPPAGIITNNPLGTDAERWAIVRHMRRSIDAVPKRQKIRVASWNIRSGALVDSLIRAHRRGVSVRVVVDRGNANPSNPNSGVDRLERALRGYGNGTRSADQKSGLRRCVSACRGRRGIAHTKFLALSQAGSARWVVINGSANLTNLAATHQWNDVYTTRGRRGVHDEFVATFDQMYADRAVAQGYRFRRFSNLDTIMLPWTGRGTQGDPSMRDLNAIRCKGATNTGNRRTKIRIAMTSWHGQRGVRLARKVRALYDGGCDVKIVYGVMGNEILRIMRNGSRGPIPFRQVVQDFDGDGVYDRYLHTKVITVQGRYGGARGAWVTVNGSLNWTPVPLASDEAVMRIRGRGAVRRYSSFVNHWYANTPTRQSSRTSARMSTATAPEPTVVPLGRLVDGVDPYAELEQH